MTRETEHITARETLGFLLARATFLGRQKLRDIFREGGHNISPEQWGTLNILWQKEGLSQVELAEKTFKNKPNLTRIIDALEKKGLVTRQKDQNDRRVYKIYLTDKGRGLRKELAPLAMKALNLLQKGFSEKELKVLKSMLKRIYKNVK